MKKYVRLSLTICLCLLIVACKTAQLTEHRYEGRATATERADTLIERDSVIVFMHDGKDTVRIVQREVRWRERVKVQHDTLTVIKTDTIIKTTEPKIRSPVRTFSTLKTWLHAALIAFATFIIMSFIIKLKQL